MSAHALLEERPWLVASIGAALAWYGLRDNPIPEPWLIGLKGSAVVFLAIYALLRHAGTDSRLLALVMALSALGDMAMELWTEIGGLLFFAAHIAAIALYLRHRRALPSLSQNLAAIALILLTPLIAWMLTFDPAVGIYAAALGGMAAAAWASRFHRYRVGVGAVLFVVSDLLIFAKMGFLGHSPLPGLLIWPLYYFGQVLICTGVIAGLRGRGDDVITGV